MKHFKLIPLLTLITGITFSGYSQAATARFFTYDPLVLAHSKLAIAHHSAEYQAAYDNLIQQANAALTHQRYSVADKTLLPASGDKHDYYSFGPYWWPNPDTPDHLPYVQRDGQTNPDSKTDATDSKRMVAFSSDMTNLSLAYYFSGDIKYAQKARDLVTAWFINPATRMNPNMEYAQAIPGITSGRGIGIIDSRVLIAVLDSIELIRPANVLSEPDYQTVKAWYAALDQWLLNSRNGADESATINNHSDWYDAQVVAFSLFANRSDLAIKQLQLSLNVRLAQQIDQQGYLPEELSRTRSWHYTNFALEAFVRLARYGELLNINFWSDDKLKKALLIVVNQIGQSSSAWSYPELNYQDEEAFYNLQSAYRAYRTPSIAQKSTAMISKYPTNLNILTVGKD